MYGGKSLAEYKETDAMNEDVKKLIEIIKDPPVYSIPFLGDPSEHVQGYRKAMDTWYCKILDQVRILEESR